MFLLAYSSDVITVTDATTWGICVMTFLNISKPCFASPTCLLMTSGTLYKLEKDELKEKENDGIVRPKPE